MRKTIGALGLCMGLVLTAVVAVTPAVGAPGDAKATALRGTMSFDAVLGGNFSKTGTWEPFSTPAIGDITGDGQPEIVAATVDGTVRAITPTGEVLWQRTLGAFAIHASPVLADLDHDGRADVIIAGMDGHVYWLDGVTGGTRRVFSEGPVLYCPVGVDCRPHGFFATPVVADLNGDGRPEIIAPSWDHTVYAWEPDGRQFFRAYLQDTLWSSPTVADIDGDGRPEIVLGGDIWNGNPFHVPQGGLLWVLRADGSPYPGYPRSFPGQVIWSSPAVVDLNGDGNLDIVAATGTHDPFGDGPATRVMYAITARTGASLPGWPVALDGRAMDGPAVGDLDGDGRLDVSIATEGGYVDVFRADGTRMWSACAANDGVCGAIATHGSTVIADVDNDSHQDVVTTLDQTVIVYDGATGAVKASYRLPAATYWPASAPSVVDINGKATIVTETVRQGVRHPGVAAAGDVMRIQLVTTGLPLCQADWPTFKRSAARNATFPLGTTQFAPFPCVRRFVAQQYKDFLGRTLDGSGQAFWTNRLALGWTGPQVIQAFMDSNEFGRARSPLIRVELALTGAPPPDSTQFYAAAYQILTSTPLDRIANRWATADATVDREGRPVAGKTDAVFVNDAYRFTLGRPATAAELSLGRAALHGGSRGAWLATFAMTATITKRLVPEVYVTMSYLGMLNRPPDAGGYAFWVPKVRAGTSIRGLIGSFQRSVEYRRRVIPA